MDEVPILLNKPLLDRDIRHFISWVPHKAPHGIIVGATGSGKTYFSTLLLGKLSLYMPDMELYVCDYKGDDDFCFLSGKQHFYRFRECGNGLDEFYNRFLNRQNSTDNSRTPLFLFFDEYASFLNGIQDKKQQEQYKLKMSNILMMGRSYRCHVIIAQQRGDSEYFKAARDNLTFRVGLGNLSTESVKMLFSDYMEQITPDKGQGKGYMSDGEHFYEIVVPTVTDTNKLHNSILSVME